MRLRFVLNQAASEGSFGVGVDEPCEIHDPPAQRWHLERPGVLHWQTQDGEQKPEPNDGAWQPPVRSFCAVSEH
jgi:hypothetical protein